MAWPHSFGKAFQGLWFHLLCFDTQGKKDKLGARSRKIIFLGYSNTSKGYRLYDEVNKKFVIARYVIFLESSKTDNVVEQHLDRLDKFGHAKSSREFDN